MVNNASTSRAPRILIVEDDRCIRLMLREVFAEGGFAVSVASSGVEALSVAMRSVPDVIVADWSMPDMDGVEMLQRLMRSERTSEIPAVLLTAAGHRLNAASLRESGLRMIIGKPFSTRELLMQVNSLLGGTLEPGQLAAGCDRRAA